MTDPMPDPPAQPTPTAQPEASPPSTAKTRRRFLTVLGAGGLATAAAVFGRSSVAFAGNYQCCNLRYPPPDSRYVSYSNCSSYSTYPLSHYTWGCSSVGGLHCNCCEGKTYGYIVVSAASCQYN